MSSLKRTFTLNEALDYHSFRVFQRLQRFYKSLNVVSALLSGLSLAVLTFDEFHPTESEMIRASEGLLCSSAMSSVISITMSTMLLFKFEGYESATRRDFLAAWSPLMLLDVAIMEFLIGLALWYAAKNDLWRTGLMSGQLTILLGCCFIIATWMYVTRSFKRLVEKDRKVNMDTELGVLPNGDIKRLSRCHTQTGFV